MSLTLLLSLRKKRHLTFKALPMDKLEVFTDVTKREPKQVDAAAREVRSYTTSLKPTVVVP